MHSPKNLLIAFVLAFATTACAGPSHQPPQASPTGSTVIPDFEGGHWIFLSDRYGHAAGSPRQTPPNVSTVLTSATDLDCGWSAVAYRNHLATLPLFGGDVTWYPADFGSGVPRLGIGSELLAAATGRQIQLYDLEDGSLLLQEDAGAWLRQSQADRLVAAVPLSRERMVLIGDRSPRLLGGEEGALISRVDFSRGRLEAESSESVPYITRVQGVANIGPIVFVAGINESYQMGAGMRRGRSFTSLVIVRFDATTGSARLVVRSLEHERDRALRALIASRDPNTGQELLAILLEDGEIRAFGVLEQGTTSAPIFELPLPGTLSIAWVDATAIVAQGDAGSRRLSLR